MQLYLVNDTVHFSGPSPPKSIGNFGWGIFDECFTNPANRIRTHVFVVDEKCLNLTFASTGEALSGDAEIPR